MALSPLALMKLHAMWKAFEKRHPGVVNFGQKELFGGNIPEGTVFELSLTRPGEQPVTTNMKLTAEDITVFEALKEMM